MWQFLGNMTSGYSGIVVQGMTMFLFIMFVLYCTAKWYKEITGKLFLDDVLWLIKYLTHKLVKANTAIHQFPVMNEKLATWIVVLMFCVFSAIFSSLSIIILTWFISSDTTGLQNISATAFISVHVVAANMFRVKAQKIRESICEMSCHRNTTDF